MLTPVHNLEWSRKYLYATCLTLNTIIKPPDDAIRSCISHLRKWNKLRKKSSSLFHHSEQICSYSYENHNTAWSPICIYHFNDYTFLTFHSEILLTMVEYQLLFMTEQTWHHFSGYMNSRTHTTEIKKNPCYLLDLSTWTKSGCSWL